MPSFRAILPRGAPAIDRRQSREALSQFRHRRRLHGVALPGRRLPIFLLLLTVLLLPTLFILVAVFAYTSIASADPTGFARTSRQILARGYFRGGINFCLAKEMERERERKREREIEREREREKYRCVTRSSAVFGIRKSLRDPG